MKGKDSDIVHIAESTGKASADILMLKEDSGRMDERLDALENRNIRQDLVIARCTAIWGFIIAAVSAIGGFIVYNFIKVKIAIIAVFHAFYEGN